MKRESYFHQRAQFERHLAASWDDHQSWLVYGDLLLERGDPRGDLIVIENALASRPPRDERAALVRARGALHRRLLGQLADRQGLECRWEWGAVRGVTLTGEAASLLPSFLRLACARLLESVELREVETIDFTPVLRALDRTPVSRLALRACTDYLVRFAITNAQRQLGGLRELEITDCWLGARGARALANATRLRSLSRLALDGCGLNARALGMLLEGLAAWPSLRALGLAGVGLGDDGARVLAGARLPALLELDLSRARIGNAGALALSRASSLAGLERLRIEGNTITDDGLRALADSPVLSEAVRRSIGA